MPPRTHPITPSHPFPGSELTGDVLEFIKAMAAYQKRYARRYPAWSEVLYVLRTLGYAKRVPGADYSERITLDTEKTETSFTAEGAEGAEKNKNESHF